MHKVHSLLYNRFLQPFNPFGKEQVKTQCLIKTVKKKKVLRCINNACVMEIKIEINPLFNSGQTLYQGLKEMSFKHKLLTI